jgi:hypothetical protein
MSDVLIVHPPTGNTAVVPEEAVHHYRRSGWLLQSEHDENQAQAAAAAAKAPKAKAAAKSEDE